MKNMIRFALIYLSAILPITLISQTIISGGNVFGIWNAAGSPYILESDVTIPGGGTLIIKPGVEIRGNPDVDFIVNGRLLAVGTEDSTITFTAADTINGWGGIEFHDSSLDDSEISNSIIQHALAGIYIDLAFPMLKKLKILKNKTGIYGNSNMGANGINYFNDIEFYENNIGFYAYWTFFSEFNNCLFYHNNYGVLLDDHAGETDESNFNYCLFYKNEVGFASQANRRHPHINNCTITDNTLEEAKIGNSWPNYTIYFFVENSIIWGSEFEDGISYFGNTVIEASYSDISFFNGTWNGIGNINEDPRFSNPLNCDFSLLCTSPCINAGNPSRKPDPDGSVADMGALWFDPSTLGGSAENDGPVCEGGDATLMANGGISYEWSGPNGFTSTSQNPILSSIILDMEGEYFVSITTDEGCLIELSTEVLVNSMPEAAIDGKDSFCEGGSTILMASGGADYNWNTSENMASITVSAEGNYTVTVTDGNGCTDTAMVMVIVHDLPTVEIALERDTFCINETTVELTGGTPIGGNYSGSGVTGNIFEPSEAGVGTHLITYTYEDTNGCSNSDSQVIIVEDGDCTTGLNTSKINESSNIFPNPSDGLFTLQTNSIPAENLRFDVLNMHGQVVLENTVHANPETVDLRGQPAGVYFIRLWKGDIYVIQRIFVQ